jgi:hypothetical protein
MNAKEACVLYEAEQKIIKRRTIDTLFHVILSKYKSQVLF